MESGSKITGNSYSSGNGGGVYVSGGTLAMSGGTISGNTASNGGGVYVSGGTLAKQSGGTIYGSNASGRLKNTANGDSYGHAVYVSGSPARIRNGTAKEGVTLDSTKSGAEGGWETPIPNLSSLTQSLEWLSANAVEGGSYTIVLNADESLAPRTLSYRGKNVTITLTGGASARTVSLNANGALFIVDSGAVLTLGNNVALQGWSGNTSPLTRVNSGGTLTMESGSKICGNTNTASNGGGVVVNSGGAVTINGGEISGNTVSGGYGGGVYVNNGGEFIKQPGGTIYGSNASSALKNTAGGDSYGHAVYVSSGGKIRNGTIGEGVTLDSSLSGVEGGWMDQWMVTFDADGESPATQTQTQTVNGGGSLGSVMPSDPTRNGYNFGGWYTQRNGGGTPFTATTAVTGDMTLYAKWTAIQYTVTYNANGGDGAAPSAQTAAYGTAITLADGNGLAKAGYALSGWNTSASGEGDSYAPGASFTVTSNITLHARWNVPDNLSLAESLTWISGNTIEGGAYTILLNSESEAIAPKALSYSGKTVSVTITGGAVERTVSLNENGSLFTVGSGVTLTLGNNVTLLGRSNNTASLVKVETGGTLEMNIGSKITGNTFSSGSGGGVYVDGTFIMSGGTISGNAASSSSTYSYGGGVYAGNGMFIMSGGTISGNTASSASSSSSFTYSYGGGVYAGNGTFIMSGGTIRGYTASSSSSSSSSASYSFSYGGGVYADNGTFIMNGGTISGNTASSAAASFSSSFSTTSSSYGGGVCVNGTFTMSGGAISGNTASSASSFYYSASSFSSNGGGVWVSGTFTMSGGTISGNTASSASSFYTFSSNGGGVWVGGTFTMSGGTISGNTSSSASSSGGGVYVRSGSFTKESGGIIYGSDADSALKNTTSNGGAYGHAVYAYESSKKRNTTAGEGVTLDSTKSGTEGGWE
jgi:uncharacterized repeat protein (TIGR02543 family)